jgi:hypothetical protein
MKIKNHGDSKNAVINESGCDRLNIQVARFTYTDGLFTTNVIRGPKQISYLGDNMYSIRNRAVLVENPTPRCVVAV